MAIDPQSLVSPNPELMQALGGMQVVELNHDKPLATLEFSCLPEFCHSNASIAQGGYITAWMDAAMAHAVLLTTQPVLTVASLDINVRFLERVGPGKVLASGWVVRRGRKVAAMEATLRDASGKLLATATSSGLLVPLEPES